MQQKEIISQFRDEYQDFSNFSYKSVEFDKIIYGSSEACFQAQKTLNIEERKKIAGMTPGEAKRYGGRRGPIKLRRDWESAKYPLMRQIVEAKFRQHPDLKELLLSTGHAYLKEGNTWHDNDWGVCTCPGCANKQGQNNLGITLMDIRELFRREKWVSVKKRSHEDSDYE